MAEGPRPPGGVASAGSCAPAGLQRGKELLAAERRRGSGAYRSRAGREGGGPRGARRDRLGVSSCSFFVAMKRPCEETTSESDLDETIDVGSENNYSG